MRRITGLNATLTCLIVASLSSIIGAQGLDQAGLVELNSNNFQSELSSLEETSDHVLIEFMAHWCPACRAFQPTYEEIATRLAARGEMSPRIAAARVDCADAMNGQLCTDFGIASYPTLFLGRAEDVERRSSEGLMRVEPRTRTVPGVIKAIESLLDVKLEDANEEEVQEKSADAYLKGRKFLPDNVDKKKRSNAQVQMDVMDVEGATIQSWAALTSPVLLQGAEARQALLDWLQLLGEAHPIYRCRYGASQAEDIVEDAWPTGLDAPRDLAKIAAIQICGRSSFKSWGKCKESPSNPESGGYTCALWQLFHSLAAGISEEDTSAGRTWLIAVRGFVKHFFQCSDCSKHFVSYASSDEANAVKSKHDAMVWLWKTHNVVNERLSKPQWPSSDGCLDCLQSDGEWNDAAVLAFLKAAYAIHDSHSRASIQMKGRSVASQTSQNGWSGAFLLCGVVAGIVYSSLRGSSRYSLKRQYSRRKL